MAVNNKAAPKSTNPPRTAVPSVPSLAPVDPTANGKRKKKKKGKSRSEAYEEEDEEEMPPLESTTITGLSPELESAHLSANAALEKARASREELEATATELYSHFMDPPGHFGSGTDDYWNSLPTQTRDFVRDIHSQAALAGTTDTTSKAQTMYSMAQHVIQTGKIPTKVLPGSYPVSSIPFDPSVLSDPAIKLSLEAAFNAVAANGGLPSLNFDDAAYNEAEYDSEDEGEDVLEEMDGHDANRRNGANGANPIGSLPATEPSKRTKKKRSKKKTSVVLAPTHAQPPPITTTAPPPRPVPAPATTAPPTPAAPTQSTRPPQSSRAAGKQPMSYAPPPANTRDGGPPPLIPPPATGNRPSARAASKQPLSNYGGGHHPQGTPPSSNSTASGKHRPPPGSAGSGSSNNPKSANKIWSTNSLEERERIKEFWLNLGEQDRRDLVKVEKEAVLRKMKEQQKHSCSCAVCGRKRTAIEEELEVLYDAYYEDLEHYANLQQQHVAGSGPPPPGPGPFPGSVELDQNGAVIGVHGQQHPSTKHPPGRGKHHAPATNGVARKGQPRSVPPPPPPQDDEEYEEEDGDEYDEDEEYDDEEEEEEGEDEDDGEEDDSGKPSKRKGGDMFSFSSNFTAAGPGNILTVADDLLKNDGQKFLEMMEQLAERRMMREEEAAASIEENSDEDDQDEEDDEEDEEDEEDEDEEDRVMTEEQKMQQGRRMFSIFAARMFEQRVLQAYRERVAQERQLQLLRELEDEERAAAQKDAKKQSANQKKKDKKRQQKAVKDEERLRRESERAEEEAAAKARQEALEETQRKKREEERLRRETERLRKEEERMRVADERRKRIAEEQRKAAEKAAAEQKRAAEKAAKERDRKEREERERKVKEEAAREERERKAREDEARKEKEARDAAERKAAELAQQQKQVAAAKAAAAAKTTPPSPRNIEAQRTATTPKKLNSKPPQAPSPPSATPRPVAVAAQPQTPAQPPPQTPAPAPAPAATPITPVTSPPTRQAAPRPSMATASPVPVLHQQPPQPGAHPIPVPGSSQHLPTYAQQQQTPLAPPGIASPPVNFVPPSPHQPMPLNGGFPPHVPYNASFQQSQGVGLGPSALPRGYPTPIETNFDGNMGFQKAGAPGLPPPIGPPKTFGAPSAIGSGSALSSPVAPFPPRSESLPSVNGIGAHMRRGSLHEPVGRTNPHLPAYGAVQRPIAPISRPVGAPASSSQDADEKVPSGSSSRRSPSPTFLGSKALLNEDDEPILPTSGRRVGVSANSLASGWGAPGEPHKALDPIGRGMGSSSWSIPHSSNNLWTAAPFAHPQPPNVPFAHQHHPFPGRPPAPSTTPSQGN